MALGLGDSFLKWLLSNQENKTRCRKVALTPCDDASREFEEFPDDPRLAAFDPSDRKFVAVARKHPKKPPIVYSIERGWDRHEGVRADHGVRTRRLC